MKIIFLKSTHMHRNGFMYVMFSFLVSPARRNAAKQVRRIRGVIVFRLFDHNEESMHLGSH